MEALPVLIRVPWDWQISTLVQTDEVSSQGCKSQEEERLVSGGGPEGLMQLRGSSFSIGNVARQAGLHEHGHHGKGNMHVTTRAPEDSHSGKGH